MGGGGREGESREGEGGRKEEEEIISGSQILAFDQVVWSEVRPGDGVAGGREEAEASEGSGERQLTGLEWGRPSTLLLCTWERAEPCPEALPSHPSRILRGSSVDRLDLPTQPYHQFSSLAATR